MNAFITMYSNDNETLLTDSELETRYDEFLDETYSTVNVAGLDYDTSRVLKEIDPIAYRTGMSDWSDEYTEHNVPLDDYLSDDFDAETWLDEHNG